MRQLDSLLSQIAGVISGFDLADEIGPHSLGFGSSSSAMSWGANAGAPGVDTADELRITTTHATAIVCR
jgi:hypothetical protein